MVHQYRPIIRRVSYGTSISTNHRAYFIVITSDRFALSRSMNSQGETSIMVSEDKYRSPEKFSVSCKKFTTSNFGQDKYSEL